MRGNAAPRPLSREVVGADSPRASESICVEVELAGWKGDKYRCGNEEGEGDGVRGAVEISGR